MSEENKTVELKDEDLEKVTGGSHMSNGRTYSDSTYADFGFLEYQIFEGQQTSYHPLIVFGLNSCSKCRPTVCGSCQKSFSRGISLYCRQRSEELDYDR